MAKDRKNEILEIEKNLKEKGIKTNFKIVENAKDFITYEEYLDEIKKSKSIVDIVGKSQSGLTLRALEALFYKKKLITNNKNVKDYDFYCKDNIFIIGEDNYDNISDFLNIPFNCENYDENVKKYSYQHWVEKMIGE